MKTSHIQFIIMVDYMERNGDLSKPTGGPRGRHFIQKKWKELTNKLNSEGNGDPRSEEKWRKVWSDLKANTKKKFAKINKAARGTGGGPALNVLLTDLEERILRIIGVQAATGMTIIEAGFDHEDEASLSLPPAPVPLSSPVPPQSTQEEEKWNIPGTSSQDTIFPPPPSSQRLSTCSNAVEEDVWKPPPQKKRKNDRAAELFLEADRLAREHARERAVAHEQIEREKLRIQEFESRERVRQREIELNLQAQWLEFLKDAMNVVKCCFERNEKKE